MSRTRFERAGAALFAAIMALTWQCWSSAASGQMLRMDHVVAPAVVESGLLDNMTDEHEVVFREMCTSRAPLGCA